MLILIINVLFFGFNTYNAVQSFKRKQWPWFAISSALALYCTYVISLSFM